MKKTINIVFLAGILTLVSAFTSQIKPAAHSKVQHFTGNAADLLKSDSTEPFVWLDFESGFAKASKENKILLVDVFTDWCGWCKVMDKKTYTQEAVIKKINENFVPVKLNPEKDRNYTFGDKTMSAAELHKWLGYGQTFGFPTTYFMVAPGSTDERYAQVGYMEADEFLKILDLVIAKK